MYKNKSIVAVIPAHNEETQIGRVITTMPGYVDHIVIVDDCSPDRTSEVVQQYIAEGQRRVVLLRHETNQGVGGAIATGYKWARDRDLDIAVVMAGDGQMDPRDLPAILDPVADENADYSKANRLFTGEAYRKIPKVRYFGNSILSLLTKIASGYWHIADSQAGYAAINKKALHTLDWDKMYKRYGQPNDILVKLNVCDFRVVDVPTEPVYGVGERSGIKIRKVIFTIGWLIVRLFFWRLKEKYIIRDFHPLVFFYLFGLSMLGMSGAFFGRLLVLWYQQGHVPEITALVWMFTGTTALQSLFFAMWMDMENNRDLRGHRT